MICSLIGLREVRLLERLRDRFCPKRAQSTSQAAFDINNALAFEGCDLGDGSASRNPTDATLFKRRKYPFLHDKNRGRLRRGRRRVSYGVLPLKNGGRRVGDAPRKRGCRRDLVDGSQLPREEAGNLKSLLRLLLCYVITNRIMRFMELPVQGIEKSIFVALIGEHRLVTIESTPNRSTRPQSPIVPVGEP